MEKIELLKALEAGKTQLSSLVPDKLLIIVNKEGGKKYINGSPCTNEQWDEAFAKQKGPMKLIVRRINNVKD